MELKRVEERYAVQHEGAPASMPTDELQRLVECE